MSPLRRALLIGGGLLLALVVIVVVTLMLLLRPASLKGRIERELRESTGLVLHIDGDVRWQAWPTPKLTIGAARVEEAGAAAGGGTAAGSGAAPGGTAAAGTRAAPLAQWQVLSAEAQWRPLLHGQAKLETLSLDGVALTLVRGADGAIHWPKLQPAAPAPGDTKPAEPARAISIGHLAIKNAVVRVVEGGDSATGAATSGATPATAPGTTLASLDGLAFQAGVDYDPAAGTLRLAQPAALTVIHGGTLQPDGLRLVFDAPAVTIKAAPLTLDAKLLHVWLGKLEAGIRPEGPLDLDARTGAGELTLALRSLREFSAALGAELPPTRDPAVFGPFTVQAMVRADAAGLALDPLAVNLDGLDYTGRASVPAGGPAAGHPARFALKGGKLDLRRYLRPKDKPGKPFELPVEWLRAQHVEGVLELQEAHAIVGVLHGVKIKVLDQAK
ncbi:MAG: AsmA family protein [Steroidobacteraceae bacterium]